MEHNFKFGVSYAEQRPLTAPLPLCGDVCDAFRYAKDIGLDGIEIHGREYEFTDEQVERIKVCCGELGSGHGPGIHADRAVAGRPGK